MLCLAVFFPILFGLAMLVLPMLKVPIHLSALASIVTSVAIAIFVSWLLKNT